jgi:hypothetical protein
MSLKTIYFRVLKIDAKAIECADNIDFGIWLEEITR